MNSSTHLPSFWKRRGLLVMITAAVLIELLSGAQYYSTHRLMENELEKHAEQELTMKAILVKGNLNYAEDILKDFMWKIEAHIDTPDSAYTTMRRMVELAPNLQGGGIAFRPYYYPSKGQYYEVYARRTHDGKVEVEQIGGPNHDYTKYDFYQQAFHATKGFWVDPYEDHEGAQATITSYVQPIINNARNEVVGMAMADVSLRWLTDTIDRRHIYPSSFLLLLTEEGIPVIRPSEDRISKEASDFVIGLINDSTVTRQKSSSGRSTSIYFDTDKRDGTVFYANMKGQPHWQIAVVCFDDEVYAPLSQLRVWLLFLMLVAFGILLFVIWRFAVSENTLQTKMLEQERMAGELHVASNIQQALLPANEIELNGISDVCVEGRLIPAKAVGGDLYNAFVRDGKLFFCIGDVSGKGVPAAIIMAIVQTMFHSIALRESNPAHIMDTLNGAACRNNKANMFITLFIGVIDLPTGHLRYCNAGHDVPIQTRPHKDGFGVALLDTKANLPIGLFSDFTYEMQEATMVPGSTLFLYTDGLTEARNERNEMLGMKRVMEMMTGLKEKPAKQLVEAVTEHVAEFSGNAEQSDDLTLLAISYTPKVEQLILDEELTLSNDVKDVARLSAFIKDVLVRLNIGKPLAPKLRLALEEAVVNVMEYAYPKSSTPEGRMEEAVKIRVTSDGQRMKFIITDSGVSFDPTEAATANTKLSAEERPVGGLGILLVRELMDSINYERTDGKNILTLTKTINNRQ